MSSNCILRECRHRCERTLRWHRTARGARYVECYGCGHIQVLRPLQGGVAVGQPQSRVWSHTF